MISHIYINLTKYAIINGEKCQIINDFELFNLSSLLIFHHNQHLNDANEWSYLVTLSWWHLLSGIRLIVIYFLEIEWHPLLLLISLGRSLHCNG